MCGAVRLVVVAAELPTGIEAFGLWSAITFTSATICTSCIVYTLLYVSSQCTAYSSTCVLARYFAYAYL